MNLRKLFGKTAFQKFIILGTGDDKDEALAEYSNTGCWWIEDKPENAEAGLRAGLNPILMEHGHNMSFKHDKITKVKNWKEVYETITS
jgi:beta-phosphoglucomutase-like phosphatase (HAD superfamily)